MHVTGAPGLSSIIDVFADLRAGIPHHLVDVFDPEQEFTAGRFTDAARGAISDILARGHTPIVAGGTGFYLHCLLFGKPRGGRASADLRAEAAARLEAARAVAAAVAGLAPEELSEQAAWEAGCSVLGELGDEEGMRRCSSGA